MKDALTRLIDVKSIITLLAVSVYLFMEANGILISSELKQLIMLIVAFYFGTQSKKLERKGIEENEKKPKVKD